MPRDRLRMAQVDAVFANVSFGVLGAALGAGILAAALVHVGVVPRTTGIAWASFIAGCALAHVVLRGAFRRVERPDAGWRPWAGAFTALCLAEGLGWGWASVSLGGAGDVDLTLLVQVATLAIAAGSIPVFASYLPAFWAFFLPTTLPFALFPGFSTSPVQQAILPMMTVYITAMGGLAVRANAGFKTLVRLRIETQELAERLRVQKDAAEQANRDKSSFLAAASHDLRQPVHALGLFVGALNGVALPPEGQRLAKQIEASVAAMDNLFSALLDISRLDAGVVEVHPSGFAIEPLLERIGRDHRADAEAKGLDLVVRRCSALVRTDPLLLERIVQNLVSNAVRYTDRGRVVVGCRRRGPDLAIEVWDTGRGIPPPLQTKVFEEYFQLGNPERDRTKGLGLGLAIVRRLSALLGGRLTLRSQPGRGSCFAIAVPLTDQAPDTAAPAAAALPGALAPGLVLVIDDEPAIRDAMVNLLTGWGHAVIAAACADEMLARLATEARRPDLVICDYRLRDEENGIATIERLRSEFNEPIPAMLITGDTAPDRLAEARESGLLLLHKPVPNGKLRAAIVHLMARPSDDADRVRPRS